MGEDFSAVAGGGLVEHAVLVKAQINGVGGEAGFQADHQAGSQIPSDAGCAVKQNGGLVFLCQLCQRLLIGPCAVHLQAGGFRDDDLLGPAGNQCVSQLTDIAAQKNGRNDFSAMRLQLLGFGQQLENCRMNHASALLGKNPNSAVFFAVHLLLP